MTQHAVHRETIDRELVGLTAWRSRRLQRAGFDAALADVLVKDRRVDLHALLELVDAGCPPGFAARILAPLDDPEPVLR